MLEINLRSLLILFFCYHLTIWGDVEAYVEFIKECMSIFLFSDLIFHMWEMGFVEWENYNILDKTWDVLTRPPMSIEKSTFGYLSNLKEKQLKTLTWNLLAKTIIIHID
jgi:hypothetical protein